MKPLKHIRSLCFFVACLLGAIDSWSFRYSVNPMGIAYLDMGDAFMRGDWQTALNGLWSPLYSLPLGFINLLFKPGPTWEFPLIHLVNLLIFLAALGTFNFFLSELLKRTNQQDEGRNRTSKALPGWVLLVLGHAVFIWCSLGLIRMATTAPDLLLSAFVYLAFGMLIRIERGQRGWLSFLLLGLIIGLGYLAKAPMLPLGVLFILAGLLLARDWRKSGWRLAAAMLGLLLSAGPFMIALSVSRHRLTFGDSSRLNYAWHVNRVPFFHWQGDAIHGTPFHPTRKIFDHPAVYEFATPLNATYPPWYDPSYWYEGVVPRFNLQQQKVAVFSGLRVYRELISFRSHLTLVAGFLLLLYICRKERPGRVLAQWPLLLLSIASLALFLPVHAEPRYVAAFIPPFWMVLFSSLHAPRDQKSLKRAIAVALVMTSVITVAQASRSVLTFWRSVNDTSKASESQLQIAEELTRRGFRPGDAVGLLNFNSHWLPMVHWARLNRLRIVAELPNTESAAFATSDTSRRQQVIDAISRTGAKAIVATSVPDDLKLDGWDRLGETSYYVLKLNTN